MTTYGLDQEKKKGQSWKFLFFMLFMLFCTCIFITQYIAYMYAYNEALGNSFFGAYLPWQWYVWYKAIPYNTIFEKAFTFGTLFFVIPVSLVMLFMARSKPKGNKSLHGSATWATHKEIKQTSLLDGKGVYLGGFATSKDTLSYLRHDGAEHIMVFAPTRSGKGIGIVVPTLLSWEESCIVLDIKGENWALSSGYRKSIGHICIRFDPTNDQGCSASFNPLAEIRMDSPKAIPDTQNIASMIVDPDGKGLKDYWNKAAFSCLSGTILHCIISIKKKHGREANLCDLSTMLADPEREVMTVFEEMLDTPYIEYLNELYGEDPQRPDQAIDIFIKASAREMTQKAENELSGVVSTVLSNLSLYRDPIVAQNTSKCDFRVRDIMNSSKPVSLYLVISPNDIERVRPLTRLIINIIMARLLEKMEFENGKTKKSYQYRLLLLLDEFTSLGKLEIFEKALAYMAGYGVKSLIIIQDLAQLQKEYTKDESIMSNCHIKVAYAPNKVETAKLLSDMTGKTTVVEKKTSLSGSRSGSLKNASVSINETARALLTADEVMRLPGLKKEGSQVISSGDVLIFVAGFAPIYGKQMPYFFDPVFNTRVQIAELEKSDTIHNQFTQNTQKASREDKDNKDEEIFRKHFNL